MVDQKLAHQQNLELILGQIQQQLLPITELSASLITQAALQAYTEDLYNQLSSLAYEGMQFLSQVELGQVIDQVWLDQRTELVARAQRLVEDAPNAEQPIE